MLFLSGVCLPSLATTSGPLRTRQLLLFPFWRVPSFPLQRHQGRSAHVSSCFFLFGVCLPSLATTSGPLRTRQLLLFLFWRVPAFPCNGIRAAPHTSALAFFFWRVPAFSGTGVRAAPHTSPLAFSFLACACLPLQRHQGRSAHVSSYFFLFGVCLPSLELASGPLRTSALAFFLFGVCLPSLATTSGPLRTRQLLLFPFGVCLPSLELASGPLRTRQLLLFPFWRVPSFPCNDIRAAPHTSALAFSFLACVFLLWNWRQGRSAHVSSCFFLFGVCLPSLATTSGPLRTRQLLLFPSRRVSSLPMSHFKRIYKKYNIFLARLPSPCYNIDKTKGPSKVSGLLAMPGCLIWDPHMYENAAVFRGV